MDRPFVIDEVRQGLELVEDSLFEVIPRISYDLAAHVAMYQRWPFWKTLIDIAQMVLAKADMVIARQYAELVQDERTRSTVFNRIDSEYQRTVEVILKWRPVIVEEGLVSCRQMR